jgi:glycosyltransferase involved in cell wall biosynthesis
MTPRVSIVIPVFNHERFIKECVDSVLSQDYPGLEIIVVDDGSTDGTPEILRNYGERVSVLRQPNSGAARALNRGFQAARGDWIGWLSSDDLYLPGKISAQMLTARNRPQAQLLYTDWIKIDAQGRELSRHVSPEYEPGFAIWQLLEGQFINGSSVMFRRDLLVHDFFDGARGLDFDGDLWFRLLKAGVEFVRTPGFLINYRWHEQNMSHKRLLFRRNRDATRISVVRTLDDSQLFPSTSAHKMRADVHKLVRGLVRDDCFGTAALVIKRAASAGKVGWGIQSLAPVFSVLSSPRSEPLVTLWRFGLRVRRLAIGEKR